MTQPVPRLMLGRRRFLSLATAGVGLAGIGAFGAAGCSSSSGNASGAAEKLDYIKPTDPEVAAAEATRASTGRTATYALAAGLGAVDLGGRLVDTWTYGSGAVAPERYVPGRFSQPRLRGRDRHVLQRHRGLVHAGVDSRNVSKEAASL